MKTFIITLILVVCASAASAATLPSFVGTWALADKWCKLLNSGKLDNMDMAHSTPSGMLTIYEKGDPSEGDTPHNRGDITWGYAAQSCEAKEIMVDGDTFIIKAVCEYRGNEDIKATIVGNVDGNKLRLNFSSSIEDMFYLGHNYVRCAT